MKKLNSIITHPITLSLLITFIIVFFFFPTIPQYELKISDHTNQKEEVIEYYDDLDGNGFSDRMVFHSYTNRISGVTVLFNPSMDQKEWDFEGQFNFTNNDFFFIGDFDGNGKKVIFIFTVNRDSLFLHCIIPQPEKPEMILNRFISIVDYDNSEGQQHFCIVPGGLEDFNMDGFKEFIFAVNFGISKLPRNIYSYDIKNEILNSSLPNGYFISKLDLVDLNNDSAKEIIVNGYASQNYPDTITYPVHDQYCWLIVLDKHLRYFFKPVSFPLFGYSALATFAIKEKSGMRSLFSLYRPPLLSKKCLSFLHFDHKGNRLFKKEIPGIFEDQILEAFIFKKKEIPYIAYGTVKNELYIFDTGFNQVNRIDYEMRLNHFCTTDIDSDYESEHVFIDFWHNKMAVFRQDMSSPAILNLSLGSTYRTILSIKKEPGVKPFIIIDSGVNKYFIEYDKNLFYYTRWGIYAGISIIVYLLILLIGRTQRIRLEKRRKTEKKITELQLKIVRNQMDPHFTMNAIGSVISAINRNEKEKATENLHHFSMLYRSLVLSADKISRPLREEIAFTENYLALEKFRFSDRFNFFIIIDPSVNQEWGVPKMVIQSPVENAVKHGLLEKENGGILKISATTEDHDLLLVIEDNGIGREKAGKSTTSSIGKGLQIMDQFLELYHKITGIRVESEIIDLFSDKGEPVGTRVMVRIPVKE